ncbi:MAG: AmmeMemoRadiSam system protein B [Candidatus Rokubacteria bacterium]|nr:AmmeMemoRadiSam system protein B [Candidatus Rokubacteria bacterium]
MDEGLAQRVLEELARGGGALDVLEDARAQEDEHALEVQLPFLVRIRRGGREPLRILPILMQDDRPAACRALGLALASALADRAGTWVLAASTDFNHGEPHEVALRKDRAAIDAILRLDPEEFLAVVAHEDVRMCGHGQGLRADRRAAGVVVPGDVGGAAALPEHRAQRAGERADHVRRDTYPRVRALEDADEDVHVHEALSALERGGRHRTRAGDHAQLQRVERVRRRDEHDDERDELHPGHAAGAVIRSMKERRAPSGRSATAAIVSAIARTRTGSSHFPSARCMQAMRWSRSASGSAARMRTRSRAMSARVRAGAASRPSIIAWT